MPFNNAVPDVPAPSELSGHRAELVQLVNGIFADGGTAMYDAVAHAHERLRLLAKDEPKRIYAVVVLTDGVDEHSGLKLADVQSAITQSPESGTPNVRVFTIAYGAGADTKVLAGLAEAGGGATFKGDTASIRQVYRDLAAFF